ncbi:MAG: hypothetical protein ACI8T1_002105 [Verrucomicrobiales bacterium]|jgi:hypothetical protein
MKELFREVDITRVYYYRTLLEAVGIPTMIRNEHLVGAGLTEVPIPEFFPVLCVMRDEDYKPTLKLMGEQAAVNAVGVELEVTCTGCGEINPGNFEVCWSCEAPLGGSTLL